MDLATKIVRHNWWCICCSSLLRVFLNIKGIFILEPNYNRMEHIYIIIVNQIKSIFDVSRQLVVVIKCHLESRQESFRQNLPVIMIQKERDLK